MKGIGIYETAVRINIVQNRFDEAASNIFKQHGIVSNFSLSEIEVKFDCSLDNVRYKELGGDEYFVPLIEEELKKVTFVHRLKGSRF